MGEGEGTLCWTVVKCSRRELTPFLPLQAECPLCRQGIALSKLLPLRNM